MFDTPFLLWDIALTHEITINKHMRTKTLLLTAVLGAAGIATSLAQSVYSINAVGYVNLTVPIGYSMIANPLNAPTNTLSNLIASPPNGAQFLRWNGSGFDVATFFF